MRNEAGNSAMLVPPKMIFRKEVQVVCGRQRTNTSGSLAKSTIGERRMGLEMVEGMACTTLNTNARQFEGIRIGAWSRVQVCKAPSLARLIFGFRLHRWEKKLHDRGQLHAPTTAGSPRPASSALARLRHRRESGRGR